MGTLRRSWWQNLRKHRVGILITLTIVIVGVFIFAGYWWKWGWTGFNAETGHNGSLAPKTLWDWMQLLIVPGVLALGAYVLNQAQQARADKAAKTEKQRDRESTEARAKLEREIRKDTQREVALQAYLDRMSELLLEKQLSQSQPGDEVRNVARIRTLTVMRELDAARKGTVLQFLHEAGLIKKDNAIVNLGGAFILQVNLFNANLTEDNLSGANLAEANLDATYFDNSNLRGVNLINAHLEGAHFEDADLSGARLYGAFLVNAHLKGARLSGVYEYAPGWGGADLTNADLSEANLTGADITPEQLAQPKSLKGATMPDGSIHP